MPATLKGVFLPAFVYPQTNLEQVDHYQHRLGPPLACRCRRAVVVQRAGLCQRAGRSRNGGQEVCLRGIRRGQNNREGKGNRHILIESTCISR